MTDTDARVFLVETKTTTMRLTLPKGFKMTYGPILPMVKDYDGVKTVALRIYRTEKDCVALFRDVLSFREINAITVEFLEGTPDGESWTADLQGETERSLARRHTVAAKMEYPTNPF